ncbi:tRNA nucleotidyltransferase (CCA-adding enzyme) [Fontibacillus phaseoli]|uniref:tRNA nucleotidyltransferase (CCA-adding enzyme) n=1 Tax=Fontibacillus phaseoli TaxID=1416533 RepID=A0A369BRJ9_9BACL|nr:CCA tRNA nucleotidyltransferase [Fontibacillus phaseoli]RCX23298.1 tRNA nucleotidyltransferase (CCA-adding enzyme) [Fontibacillus phaseoli]
MSPWKMVDPLMRCQGEKVLLRLLESGYQAYFVGGCVRDELMGRPVHDMDIATSAKPEDVIALFERSVPTGIQHGTVTVLLENHAFEVTTFRKEADYEDHRRPTSVEFVEGIVEDLRRRDFTMNAIAGDVGGRLIDPFDGQADIKAKVIRCVGSAPDRFNEDALRMMRGIRFASVFAFRPVKSLWSALRSGRSKISFIAMERIRVELEKMVLGPNPVRGLALLQRSGLLDYVKAPVPKAASASLPDERLTLLKAIELVRPDTPEIKWSLLLKALEVPGEEAAGLMKMWTFSNAVGQGTADLIRFDEAWRKARMGPNQEDSKALRRKWIELQLSFGKGIAAGWIERQEVLQRAGIKPSPLRDHGTALSFELEEAEWHDEPVVHTLQELAVTGGDVMRYTDKKGGPWLGELMNAMLFKVAAGEWPNDKETLLEQAKVVVNEHGAS